MRAEHIWLLRLRLYLGCHGKATLRAHQIYLYFNTHPGEK
jgi:hypothetical protein